MKPGGWKRLPHAVCLWPILRCLSRGVLAGLFEIVDSIAFCAGYLPGTRDVCDLRHEKEERKGDEMKLVTLGYQVMRLLFPWKMCGIYHWNRG